MNKNIKQVLALLGIMCSAMVTNAANLNPTIRLTSVLLPVKSSPSWIPATDALIADIKNGTLKTNTAATNPTQYVVCGYRVNWYNFGYSTTAHLWQTNLNPAAPFAIEYGQVLFNVMDIQSYSGLDDTSLDMSLLRAFSSDGNVLGSTMTFGGQSLSPRAMLFKADGTIVTNGPTSQKGVRIIVPVANSLFNGCGTQAGLNEVEQWINSFGNFSVTYTAQIIGNDATRSSVKVGIAENPAPPMLHLRHSSIMIHGGEIDRSYLIYSAAQLPGTNWVFEGLVSGTNSYIIPMNGFAKFYRATVQ
jgi:hypothetical protein